MAYYSVKKIEDKNKEQLFKYKIFGNVYVNNSCKTFIFVKEQKRLTVKSGIKQEIILNFFTNNPLEKVVEFLNLTTSQINVTSTLFSNELVDGHKLLFLKDNEFYTFDFLNLTHYKSTNEEIMLMKNLLYGNSAINIEDLKYLFKVGKFNVFCSNVNNNFISINIDLSDSYNIERILLSRIRYGRKPTSFAELSYMINKFLNDFATVGDLKVYFRNEYILFYKNKKYNNVLEKLSSIKEKKVPTNILNRAHYDFEKNVFTNDKICITSTYNRVHRKEYGKYEDSEIITFFTYDKNDINFKAEIVIDDENSNEALEKIAKTITEKDLSGENLEKLTKKITKEFKKFSNKTNASKRDYWRRKNIFHKTHLEGITTKEHSDCKIVYLNIEGECFKIHWNSELNPFYNFNLKKEDITKEKIDLEEQKAIMHTI